MIDDSSFNIQMFFALEMALLTMQGKIHHRTALGAQQLRHEQLARASSWPLTLRGLDFAFSGLVLLLLTLDTRSLTWAHQSSVLGHQCVLRTSAGARRDLGAIL